MSYEIKEASDSLQRILAPWLKGHTGFIVGGVFKDIFAGKPAKDIDIVFYSEEEYINAVVYFDRNDDFQLAYKCATSVAYDHYDHKGNQTRIDLISTRFGTPEEILKQHDFTVTRYAFFQSKEGIGYQTLNHVAFWGHFHDRLLVIDGELEHPVSSFERAFRYKGYGFDLTRDSKKKLIQQLQGANPEKLSKKEPGQTSL